MTRIVWRAAAVLAALGLGAAPAWAGCDEPAYTGVLVVDAAVFDAPCTIRVEGNDMVVDGTSVRALLQAALDRAPRRTVPADALARRQVSLDIHLHALELRDAGVADPDAALRAFALAQPGVAEIVEGAPEGTLYHEFGPDYDCSPFRQCAFTVRFPNDTDYGEPIPPELVPHFTWWSYGIFAPQPEDVRGAGRFATELPEPKQPTLDPVEDWSVEQITRSLQRGWLVAMGGIGAASTFQEDVAEDFRELLELARSGQDAAELAAQEPGHLRNGLFRPALEAAQEGRP